MENNPKKNVFDLKLLQKQYFDACVGNVTEANEAVKSVQNWLLVLGLAEMSFLGSLIVRDTAPNLYVKVILTGLLVSFILFLIGTRMQHRHVLKSARYYQNLSSKVIIAMESSGNLVTRIPSDLKVEENQIKSNKTANILISVSFLLVLLSTVAIIFFIFYQ